MFRIWPIILIVLGSLVPRVSGIDAPTSDQLYAAEPEAIAAKRWSWIRRSSNSAPSAPAVRLGENSSAASHWHPTGFRGFDGPGCKAGRLTRQIPGACHPIRSIRGKRQETFARRQAPEFLHAGRFAPMHEDSQPPLLRDDSALRFELRAPRFETTLPPIIDLGNSVVRNFSAEPEPLDSEQTFFKQAGYFPASATADVFAAGTDSQIRRASASLLLASDTSGNRISGSGVPHFCLPQPYCVVPPHSVCAPGLYHSQRLSFDEDLEQIWPVLKKDVKGIANWNNTAILTMAGGGAIAMRQGLDEDVRDYTARHPERWGTATEILGELGNPTVQIPVLVGVYGYSLYHQDQELHDFSGSLISAYTLTGIGTVLIKAIANTDRPTDQWNGGQFGFPSYHAASSFALAGVVDEYYGPYAALPAYALAGAISWSRIDERDHDLSDVFFGAAFGYVIGKAVAGRHLRGDSRVRILPFIQPIDGTRGILLETCF